MTNYEKDKDRGHWTCELDGGIGTLLDKKSSSNTRHFLKLQDNKRSGHLRNTYPEARCGGGIIRK